MKWLEIVIYHIVSASNYLCNSSVESIKSISPRISYTSLNVLGFPDPIEIVFFNYMSACLANLKALTTKP